MYIVLTCSIIAVFLTFLEAKGILRHGMKLGFALVTFLGVIHYEYGSDYMAYMDMYDSIISHDLIWSDLIEGNIYKEPGWALINFIFKPFGDNGFFIMVALLNILQNLIYYKIIQKYLPQEDWTFGTLIYLFTSSLYLLNFSMMRQGLTVAIFLAMWPLIEKRRVIWALLITLLASTIHGSALILIPFVFIGYLPVGKFFGKIIVGVYIIVFAALLVSKDFINLALSIVISFSETFQDYTDTYAGEESTATFRLGFALKCIPIILSLIFINNSNVDKVKKQLIFISSLGILVQTMTQVTPLLSRIAFYFIAYSTIAVPLVYKNITNSIMRVGLISIFIFMMLYSYFEFYNDPIWIASYTEFKTIFSVI